MVAWKGRRGDRVRPSIAALGFERIVQPIAHHTQIVQGVCKVAVKWSEPGLLQTQHLTKQALGLSVVALRGGLFGSGGGSTGIWCVWHGHGKC
jgi:hypothetical protein